MKNLFPRGHASNSRWHVSILALAGYALAQQNDTAPSLAEALNSTTELSQLQGVLNLNPQLLQELSDANNVTILAPSNEAFDEIDNATLTGLTSNAGLFTALLQYHILNGTYLSEAITNTSAFFPTLLTNLLFTNVTGGQVVEAVEQDGNVTFYSGLLSNSSVSTAVCS